MWNRTRSLMELKPTEKNWKEPDLSFTCLHESFRCIPGLRNAKRVPRMNLSILKMLVFWCGMRRRVKLAYLFQCPTFLCYFTVYNRANSSWASEPQQFFNSSTNNSCRCVGVALLEGMGGGGSRKGGVQYFRLSFLLLSCPFRKVAYWQKFRLHKKGRQNFFGYQRILGSKLCRTFPKKALKWS